jgi:LEA14-like dessication related protein
MGPRRHRFVLRLPALLLLPVTGCALTGIVARFEPPAVTLTDSKVVDLSPSRLTAVFAFEVHNPNGYDLRVRRVRYRIRVQGTTVAEDSEGADVDISAHDSGRVELTVELGLGTLRAAAPAAMITGEVPYTLEADFSVGPLFASHTVAVTADSALRLDLPMELASVRGVALPHRPWQTFSQDAGMSSRARARLDAARRAAGGPARRACATSLSDDRA